MAVKLHHTQRSRAAKFGITLEVKGNEVEAYWPERNRRISAASGTDAIERMLEIQRELKDEEHEQLEEEGEDAGSDSVGRDIPAGDEQTEEELDGEGGPDQEGDGTGDTEGEEEGRPSASVVKEKFRLRYAELGHPSHCGDWLAEVLNNQVKAEKSGEVDMARFMQIMDLNEIDMAKYKVTGQGWQGRYRMTGRNKLETALLQRTELIVPDMNGEDITIPVPESWKQEMREKRNARRKAAA